MIDIVKFIDKEEQSEADLEEYSDAEIAMQEELKRRRKQELLLANVLEELFTDPAETKGERNQVLKEGYTVSHMTLSNPGEFSPALANVFNPQCGAFPSLDLTATEELWEAFMMVHRWKRQTPLTERWLSRVKRWYRRKNWLG